MLLHASPVESRGEQPCDSIACLRCGRLPDSLCFMFGFSAYSLMGFCLGFMLGVGCALAVMYSIYRGGYRAALKDMPLSPKPKRWDEEMARTKTKAS